MKILPEDGIHYFCRAKQQWWYDTFGGCDTFGGMGYSVYTIRMTERSYRPIWLDGSFRIDIIDSFLAKATIYLEPM